MTDTYKNKGLFFAQNSRSYGLAPCHLYSRIQAEGSPSPWKVPVAFQKDRERAEPKDSS